MTPQLRSGSEPEGPGFDGIRATIGRGAFKVASAAIPTRLQILIFHRVRAEVDPLFPLEPDARRFDQLMGLVARNCRVLRLSEAAALLSMDRLPRRSLVITFDDGYADNATVALPILRRHGLSATFFIATGFLDGGRMWNDSVIESVRRTRVEALDLSMFGLGRMPLGSLSERRACIDALLPKVKYLGQLDRATAVTQLQDALAVDSLPEDLMLGSDQVRELHRTGMEVGAHTVTHPILTALDAPDAEREIVESRGCLQEITQAPVTAFAYPNGQPRRDYDRRHVELVKRAGFQVAVTTARGAAAPGDNVFELPRFTPSSTSLALWSMRLIMNGRKTGERA